MNSATASICCFLIFTGSFALLIHGKRIFYVMWSSIEKNELNEKCKDFSQKGLSNFIRLKHQNYQLFLSTEKRVKRYQSYHGTIKQFKSKINLLFCNSQTFDSTVYRVATLLPTQKFLKKTSCHIYSSNYMLSCLHIYLRVQDYTLCNHILLFLAFLHSTTKNKEYTYFLKVN